MTHLEKALKLIDNNLKDVLEFGVFEGRTISILRKSLDDSFKVFGFDSFEGLPEDWACEDGSIAGHGVCRKGYFSTKGDVPKIEGITFFKGWFEETIGNYIKIAKPIGILHVDCDLYSSTKTVLYKLNDFIVPNTIIVFDEWVFNGSGSQHGNHEQKCFYEWVKDFNRQYEFIDHYLTDRDEQKIVKILK
jgi:hypothetical protein